MGESAASKAAFGCLIAGCGLFAVVFLFCVAAVNRGADERDRLRVAEQAGETYCGRWMSISDDIREASVPQSLRAATLDHRCVSLNAGRLAREITRICRAGGVRDDVVALILVQEAKKLCP